MVNSLSINSIILLSSYETSFSYFHSNCSFSFFFYSCKKKNQIEILKSLPEATQVGADTFGCTVGGRLFLPKGRIYSPAISIFIQQDIVGLQARNVDDREGIDLPIRNMTKVGEYPITANGEGGYRFGDDEFYAEGGKVIITKYDREKKILSGIFSFRAKHLTSEKIVSIEQGRFDLRFP